MKNNTFFRYLQRRTFTTTQTVRKKVQPSVKTKNSSSHNWLTRQLSDPYVELAKKHNYRCRSAFKLLEIDDRFKLLHPGHIVVDCGAAPGSWTQVAVKRVNSDNSQIGIPCGKVVAIDRQPIYPIEGATIFGSTDFSDPKSHEKILQFFNGVKADVVLSDMAPNTTGVRDLDRENIINLCYAALKFGVIISKPGAAVLVKLWQGNETKKLETDMSKFYENVRVVKPQSSRSDSAEIFMLGQCFKGLKTSCC